VQRRTSNRSAAGSTVLKIREKQNGHNGQSSKPQKGSLWVKKLRQPESLHDDHARNLRRGFKNFEGQKEGKWPGRRGANEPATVTPVSSNDPKLLQSKAKHLPICNLGTEGKNCRRKRREGPRKSARP